MRKLRLRPQDEKIAAALTAFLPHVDLKNVIFVGGLAITDHLQTDGRTTNRHLDEIDLVQQNDAWIRPTLLEHNFLIAHYHPWTTKSVDTSSYWAVVHEPTRIKFDVFPTSQWPKQIEVVKFCDHQIRIRGLEDQLATLVNATIPILANKIVPPKHLTDIQCLLPIANLGMAEDFWQAHGFLKQYGWRFQKAVELAEKAAKKHPELLVVHPFKKTDPNYQCPECVSTEKWPITSFKEIFNLLEVAE